MQRSLVEKHGYLIQIRLRGDEVETPLLSETSNFLYDFNVAYELARLATDPRHRDFIFTPYAFFRNGRPLRREARLEIVRLREESPLDLLVQVAAVNGALTAVWLLVQIIEKAFNLRLNRKKLR